MLKKIFIFVVFGLVLFLTVGTAQAVVDMDVGDGEVTITSTESDLNSEGEQKGEETADEREAENGEEPMMDPESNINIDMEGTDEPILYMGTDDDVEVDMAQDEDVAKDQRIWWLLMVLGVMLIICAGVLLFRKKG